MIICIHTHVCIYLYIYYLYCYLFISFYFIYDWFYWDIYIHIWIPVYVYRERERFLFIYIYVCICICTWWGAKGGRRGPGMGRVQYIYMYIYTHIYTHTLSINIKWYQPTFMESKSSKLNRWMARGICSIPHFETGCGSKFETRGGHILVYLHCCLSNYWGAQFWPIPWAGSCGCSEKRIDPHPHQPDSTGSFEEPVWICCSFRRQWSWDHFARQWRMCVR